jgi:tetratricopeptide (TPR) repeat protein
MDLMACSREIKNQYQGLTLDEALDWPGEELPEEKAPAPSPISNDQAMQMLESIIGREEEGENEENEGEEAEDEESRKLFIEGMEHVSNGREEDAIPIFEKLIRQRNTPKLHNWLGRAYHGLAERKEGEEEKKAFEKAALHLEEAADRQRDPDTYRSTGMFFFQLGRKAAGGSELYEKAVKYLGIFTDDPKRRQQGIFLLAAALSGLANYKFGDEKKTILKRSIRLFREHIKKKNSPNTKNWLGAELYKLAQCHSGEKRVQIMEEAMPFLRESCDERGESIDYHWHGSAAMYFGRQKEEGKRAALFEEGVRSARKAVKGDDDTTNLHALGESLTELAGIKEGKEKIILLEESLSCLEKIPSLGSLLSMDGLKSDIEKEKRKLAEAKGEAVKCPLMIAIEYGYEHFKEFNHDMAAKYFTQAIRDDDMSDYVDLLSSLFERIDKDSSGRNRDYGYEQAVLCISNIAMENVIGNKGNPSHYLAFGAALAHIGLERIPEDKRGTFLLEKAMENLAKSWSINRGKNPEDLRWLGNTFVGLGDRKEGKDQVEMYALAVESGRKAVELRGGDKDKELLAEAESKYQDAKQLWDFFGEDDAKLAGKPTVLEEKTPEERLSEISIDALVWQGRKLLELADYRRAIPVFEELAKARGSREDLTTLGYCYRQQVARLEGDKGEELRHLRKSVESFERVPAAEMDERDHLEIGLSLAMLADRVERDEKLSASERLIPHLEEAIKGNAFD